MEDVEKMAYVIVTELYSEGRWYFDHYDNQEDANRACEELKRQTNIERFVIPASKIKEYKVRNCPEKLYAYV